MKDKDVLKRICNPFEFGFWVLKTEIDPKDVELKKLFEKVKHLKFEETFSNLIFSILKKNSEGESSKKIKDMLSNNGMLNPKLSSYFLESLNKNKDKINEINLQAFLKDLDYLKTFILIGTERYTEELFFYSPIEEESIDVTFPSDYSKEFSAISYYQKPLEELKKLLSLVSKNLKITITKEYSDENSVLSNYIYLLPSINLFRISENYEVIENIDQALNEFYAGKFDNSSRFCGIAMETLLSEIYLTLVRKVAPKDGLTDLVKILYSQIKEICEEKNNRKAFTIDLSKENAINLNSLIPLIEDFIEEVIEEKLKDIKKTPQKLFPEDLHEGIVKTIINRNNVSHKSSNEFGEFEASLSLRGISYLLIWWEYVKRGIKNWDKDKKTIIKEIKKESNNFLKEERFDLL